MAKEEQKEIIEICKQSYYNKSKVGLHGLMKLMKLPAASYGVSQQRIFPIIKLQAAGYLP